MLIQISRLRQSKRPVTLRPIVPTQAQASILYRIYLMPVRAWEDAARTTLIPEYARSLSQMTTDSPADLEFQIEQTDAGILQAIFGAWRQILVEWASELSAWHMSRFVANLKYATDIDLGTILPGFDGPETIDTALQRNVNLVRSVSDQTRERIADIVFRGLQGRIPVAEVARQIRAATGLSRARARRIASDQTVKLSAALDRQRMQAIGIDTFRWRHSGKAHPRLWHLERDGKVFRFDDPKLRGDLPGDQPFCGCKAQGVIE